MCVRVDFANESLLFTTVSEYPCCDSMPWEGRELQPPKRMMSESMHITRGIVAVLIVLV